MIQKLYYSSSLSCTKPKSTGNMISHMTSKIKEIKAVYKGVTDPLQNLPSKSRPSSY